jgi:hypothetical protein
MPYAGFHPDTVVVTKPTQDNLRTVAAKKPPGVTIFDYPFESFEPLGVLAGIEVLKMQGGKLRTLAGIEALTSLKNLVISTPHTWAPNRKIDIESFKPLAALTGLEQLILQGVRPEDLDLGVIERMTHLKDLDIGGVNEFTMGHYSRLAAALPNTEGRCLQPYVEIKNLAFCKKCKRGMVILNGAPPRARKWMCPACNRKKIDEHVRAWEAARASQ